MLAVAIDLALFGAIQLVERRARTDGGSGGGGPGSTAGPTPAGAVDAAVAPAWAMCMLGDGGEQPTTVAITYLDGGRDRAVNAPEIRGWFGDLDPRTVQVWQLEQIDGRRRIAFELPAASWPRWGELAARLSGPALCDALRVELIAHQVGRPRARADAALTDRETRSRHDLEFFFARRPRLYRSRVAMGSLADLTQPKLDEWLGWIDDALKGTP